MNNYLDFERPILELDSRIMEMVNAKESGATVAEKNLAAEIERLEIKKAKVSRQIYRNLSPWQKVQVARHPNRPSPEDYIKTLIVDFQPLAGDRCYGEDVAMIAGLGKFNGQAVAILGTNKGQGTTDKVAKNFGMPKPEGYRKAKRIMELANKFNLPLLTFIDTPGAYPGVSAEERGQSEAIAGCIEKLLQINVPVIATITGEGGSGGALALAVADKVIMLEYSVYSVISPEGCAAILWKEATKQTVPEAAKALCLTAQDLQKYKLIDALIKEPVGGAHKDKPLIIKRVKEEIESGLENLKPNAKNRREKFLRLT